MKKQRKSTGFAFTVRPPCDKMRVLQMSRLLKRSIL